MLTLDCAQMGSYAPVRHCLSPTELEAVRVHVMQRAVDGLLADGTPFVGVLFAGLLLDRTKGVQVLEVRSLQAARECISHLRCLNGHSSTAALAIPKRSRCCL